MALPQSSRSKQELATHCSRMPIYNGRLQCGTKQPFRFDKSTSLPANSSQLIILTFHRQVFFLYMFFGIFDCRLSNNDAISAFFFRAVECLVCGLNQLFFTINASAEACHTNADTNLNGMTSARTIKNLKLMRFD